MWCVANYFSVELRNKSSCREVFSTNLLNLGMKATMILKAHNKSCSYAVITYKIKVGVVRNAQTLACLTVRMVLDSLGA
ncbi:hypothetical protein AKJ16_DCAP21921 [Drosera capensis]